MSEYLQQFARGFSALNAHNLDTLAGLYSADVAFIDPLHRITGLSNFKAYMMQLYANVEHLEFTFEGYDQIADGEGYLRWTMQYRHPRLAGGQLISVPGCSHLRWSEKVYYHRDYFDAGALIYEHLPIMATVIRWLKGRLA